MRLTASLAPNTANRHPHRLMLAYLLAVFVVGCATTGKYEKVLDSWGGADVNRLISSWGPPSNTYTMPNGKKIYTWLNVGGTYTTGTYYEALNLGVITSTTYYCETSFTTSSSGRIETWRWKGNSCRSK